MSRFPYKEFKLNQTLQYRNKHSCFYILYLWLMFKRNECWKIWRKSNSESSVTVSSILTPPPSYILKKEYHSCVACNSVTGFIEFGEGKRLIEAIFLYFIDILWLEMVIPKDDGRKKIPNLNSLARLALVSQVRPYSIKLCVCPHIWNQIQNSE